MRIWELVFALMTAASEVEAVRIVALVLALMFDASEVDAARIEALVLAFTLALPAVIAEASDDDALVVMRASDDDEFVTSWPRDVDALPTTVLVFVLTAEVMPEVWALVLALMFEASDVDAARIAALVFAFTLVLPVVMAAASEVEAVVTSDVRASDPEVRVLSVRFRVAKVQTSDAVIPLLEVRVLVPFVQTSAARVPKVVRLRVGVAQIAPGSVE